MKIKKLHFIYFLIALLFVATRLINLSKIPIFTDEAIYVHWAQIALNDPANRFISLEDGKQPLFIWLTAVLIKFISDPLIASRLVSVFSGLASTIGIFLLSKELFSKKVAIISSLLYIIMPFSLLYDRMALYDSLLTMLGIYSVLFTVRLAKKPSLDNAFLAGFAIGAAMITKSSANFFLYLIPFSLILFDFKKEKAKRIFVNWIFYVAVAAIISFLIYNALRLSPLFYIIGRKNLDFIRPFSEVLKHPQQFTISNFKALISWIAVYETIPFFILSFAGLIYGIVKKNLSAYLIIIYIFAPFTAEVFFNKVLYPRFALFYFPYIIILASYFLSVLHEQFYKYKHFVLTVAIFSLMFPIYASFMIITKPEKAPIPKADSNQFFNDWPSGYGLREIKEILGQESKNEKITVGTQGTFGLLPYALQIYFPKNANIQIDGYWPVDEQKLPSQLLTSSQKNKTYFIFNEYQGEVTNPRLKLIAKYRKGVGSSFMRLYEVTAK